jgi:hypothetical protein
MNRKFEKELVILGIDPMKEGHSAEKVKSSIEKVSNRYSFDKKTIKVILA